MEKTFRVSISTPFGKYLQTNADFLKVTSSVGVLGILPNHAPLITTLEICELVIKSGNETLSYAISGGLMNIKPGTDVVLLVNSIERSDEIDVERAIQAKMRAEQRLNEEAVDVTRAKASIARALNRISVSSKKL